MLCSKCRQQNTDTAKFCRACGTELSHPGSLTTAQRAAVSSSEVQRYCPECGQENAERANFCRKCGNDLQFIRTGLRTRQVVEQAVRVRYAGFWRRFAAAMIDGIVVNIVTIILAFIIGFIIGAVTGGGAGAQNVALAVGYLVGILVGWIYYAGMESSSNQVTLGKKLLGLYVTDLEGRSISFLRATGRHFGKIVSLLILFIGYLMIAFTDKKQGLHDQMAGCLVVR